MKTILAISVLILLINSSYATESTCTATNANKCCCDATAANTPKPGTGVNACTGTDCTGTLSQDIAATQCSAGFYLSAGACMACTAGTDSTVGSATLVGNAETACLPCGTNQKACTVACTLDGAFKCPTTAGAVTVTATTCQQGFSLKATTPPTCVAVTTLGCSTGTTTNATPAVETCTECGADGFRPGAPSGSPAVCTACTTTGCQGCTFVSPNETCASCQDGFYDSKAVGATNSVCSPCAAGCATCPDATKCTTVKVGYQLSGAAPATPTMCGGDGKTSAGGTSAACDVACKDTNCNTCNADSTKCDVCKDNFELQTDFSCKAIETTKIHATCKAVNKPDSPDNCVSCDGTANNRQMETDTAVTPNVPKKVGKCVCKAGFGDASTASTVVAACVACGTGVKTCNIGTKTALTCTDATQVVAGNNCFAQGASAADGFTYDSTTSAFQACNSGCLTCSGVLATQCTKCPEQPATWVEPTSAASNFATYIKGPRALINGTCYNDCPSGFAANTARTGCVASATATAYGSGLFAILSIIASIFLII